MDMVALGRALAFLAGAVIGGGTPAGTGIFIWSTLNRDAQEVVKGIGIVLAVLAVLFLSAVGITYGIRGEVGP